jgi:4-alpha-glucanotransferase
MTGKAAESGSRSLPAQALAALGIERLLLTVHDASFPGREDEDPGRGSPYSFGARDFLAFAQGLGFSGLQLGPQGRTSLVNASPFDGTLFAHSTLSAGLGPLARDPRWQGVLPEEVLARLVAGRPPGARERVDQAYVFAATDLALRACFDRLGAGQAPAVAARFQDFVAQAGEWLEVDGHYQALATRYGTDDWRRWGAEAAVDQRLFAPVAGEEDAAAARRRQLGTVAAQEIAFARFGQFVVHDQHGELRAQTGRLGMKLFGDLQVGVSHRDLWRHWPIFLGDYVMGAPPSRTNPDGQPWGYPVMDPVQYRPASAAGGDGDGDGAGDGPALAFFRARLDKMLAEFDGIRIDHPHGLCCPWVYRSGDPDPLRAVQTGARLFESPDLPDHPALAAYAIARPDQLASGPSHPRYADDWVRALDTEQVARYAVLFDVLLETARRHGREDGDVAAEVLSTCPFPLLAVLARHGLGRFRVTQKADPVNPADPYRTAEASPGDWVMVGTHDTPPIWRVVAGWRGTARAGEWARYLGPRLEPDAAARPAFIDRLARDDRALVAALFADLFVGPARRVSVFFPDLFGLGDIYNAPGTVDPANWTLRVPPDYARLYADRCARGEALDLRAALTTALRARSGGSGGDLADLATAIGAGRSLPSP